MRLSGLAKILIAAGSLPIATTHP